MDRRTLTALLAGGVLIGALVCSTIAVAREWGPLYAAAWWAAFVGAIALARDL